MKDRESSKSLVAGEGDGAEAFASHEELAIEHRQRGVLQGGIGLDAALGCSRPGPERIVALGGMAWDVGLQHDEAVDGHLDSPGVGPRTRARRVLKRFQE